LDKGQYAGLSPITAGWRTHWSYLSAREPRYVLAETPTTGQRSYGIMSGARAKRSPSRLTTTYLSGVLHAPV